MVEVFLSAAIKVGAPFFPRRSEVCFFFFFLIFGLLLLLFSAMVHAQSALLSGAYAPLTKWMYVFICKYRLYVSMRNQSECMSVCVYCLCTLSF